MGCQTESCKKHCSLSQKRPIPGFPTSSLTPFHFLMTLLRAKGYPIYALPFVNFTCKKKRGGLYYNE